MKTILIVGVFSFIIALMDSIHHHAQSFSDLSTVGKVCTVIVVASVLAPVVTIIWKLTKGK